MKGSTRIRCLPENAEKSGHNVQKVTTPIPYQDQGCSVVEMRGVEPLSESSLMRLSPSAVCDLTFPPRPARRQADRFSSFILRTSPQSLGVFVPRAHDAGIRARGRPGPTSRLIRQRKRNRYCQFNLISRCYAVQGRSSLILTPTLPSKPDHPHVSAFGRPEGFPGLPPVLH